MADPWDAFPVVGAVPKKPVVDPWAEFEAVDAAPPRAPLPSGPVRIAPGARPHDGDTFPVAGGNARLFGADAFEIGQMGRNGAPADLGAAGQSYLQGQLAGGGTTTPTGSASYGRPVMTLDAGGQDAARRLIRAGLGLPTPSFLASGSGAAGRLSPPSAMPSPMSLAPMPGSTRIPRTSADRARTRRGRARRP